MSPTEALSIVSRQCPCPHDEADTSLGSGQVWAKCDNCGQTFPQSRWPNAIKAAEEFESAVGVLSRAASHVDELVAALEAICNEQDANQGHASCETYDKARAILAKVKP